MHRKIYECGKCDTRFPVLYDREQHNLIPKPVKCSSSENCDSKKFKLLPIDIGDIPNSCKDYQEVKIQEHVGKLSIGTIPRSISVVLEDDIVDLCKAGDDATVFFTLFF